MKRMGIKASSARTGNVQASSLSISSTKLYKFVGAFPPPPFLNTNSFANTYLKLLNVTKMHLQRIFSKLCIKLKTKIIQDASIK